MTERVSVASGGAQGNLDSFSPSMSADGRYVAFFTADNLVPGDTNGTSDAFVHDRLTGVTERVSVASDAAEGDDTSYSMSISPDGRYVAIPSYATNLVPGDTNGAEDVFVHDRQSGTTERVSVGPGGAEGNSWSAGGPMSADGRYVAFYSDATNLVIGDTNSNWDVFVRDRQAGTTERVSVDSSGAQGNLWSFSPSISADGRYVVFTSAASNLVTGDTNGAYDVFVHDRETAVTERVPGGAEGNGNSWGGPISADGRYVAFGSDATNLVPGDTNGATDGFVHDRQNGTTERVSVGPGGAEGNSWSGGGSMSADVRYVAFTSYATNLVPGDTNGAEDVFVHDRQSGTTERVSVDSSGAQGNNWSLGDVISPDGRYVAFESFATDLVSGDTNGHRDVFVRDRCGTPASSVAFSGDGINADTITPVNAVLGSSWSAPLTIGHPHGSGGFLVLRLRTTTINGPNFPSPGGRLTEILVGGPLLATITGSHNGVSGDVPPQSIPDQFSLAGATWAAQYAVVGGGFADLSQAVFGTVGGQ